MLNLKFTVDEANIILKGLSAMPYGEVAGLIHHLKKQGDEQVIAADSAKDVKENTDVPKPEQLNG